MATRRATEARANAIDSDDTFEELEESDAPTKVDAESIAQNTRDAVTIDAASRAILAEADEAIAYLNDLDAAATAAEVAAVEADTVFDSEPSAATHSAAAVAARVASNARARHTAATEEPRPLLAKAERVRDTAELTDLRLRINAAIAPAKTEAFKSSYLELLRALRAWAREVRDACNERNALLDRANELERRVGLGARYLPSDPEQVAVAVNDEMRELTGTKGSTQQPRGAVRLIQMDHNTMAAGLDALQVLRADDEQDDFFS